MQLRYSFHLYLNRIQRTALAEAFGCARVVFNDAVRARQDARAAGEAFPSAGELVSGHVERIQARVDCLARNRDRLTAYLAALRPRGGG